MLIVIQIFIHTDMRGASVPSSEISPTLSAIRAGVFASHVAKIQRQKSIEMQEHLI